MYLAKSRMAGFLAVDRAGHVYLGPEGVAAGLAAAAASLRRDLMVFIDVGGDVLAQGDEPGLRSRWRLADAGRRGPAGGGRAAGSGGRVRHGGDSELTFDEVLPGWPTSRGCGAGRRGGRPSRAA